MSDHEGEENNEARLTNKEVVEIARNTQDAVNAQIKRITGTQPPPLLVNEIHPLVGKEELERASTKPFKGRADMKYPELDTLEALYLAKFLVREWGWEVFSNSAYYRQWQEAAERKPIPWQRPSERKKVK